MRLPITTALLFVGGLALAEVPKTAAPVAAVPANPVSQPMNFLYDRIKKFLVESAEAMPDKDYGFKPTSDVRSFAQLIGHVADSQYMFCSAVKHEAQPKKDLEKTITDKAGLKKALGEAFAYCDPVYAQNTDASLSQSVELFGGKRGPLNKFTALNINIAHDNEHYGNIVTYLRLKKIVPPSTANDK